MLEKSCIWFAGIKYAENKINFKGIGVGPQCLFCGRFPDYCLNFRNRCNHMFGAEVRKSGGRQNLAYFVLALVVDVFDFESFLVAQGIEVF